MSSWGRICANVFICVCEFVYSVHVVSLNEGVCMCVCVCVCVCVCSCTVCMW